MAIPPKRDEENDAKGVCVTVTWQSKINLSTFLEKISTRVENFSKNYFKKTLALLITIRYNVIVDEERVKERKNFLKLAPPPADSPLKAK